MQTDWTGECDRCRTGIDPALDAKNNTDQSPALHPEIDSAEIAGSLGNGTHINGALRFNDLASKLSGERRYVDAKCLIEVIADSITRSWGHPHGLHLRNVIIRNELDLSDFRLGYPLELDSCIFDCPPRFEGTNVVDLSLAGCCVPGFRGSGLVVRRDLNLSGAHFRGDLDARLSNTQRAAVWLSDAQIGGRLACVDTKIDGLPEEGKWHCSLFADRMHVGGPVRLIHEFVANGQIRMIGAQIDGSLDLTGAELRPSMGLSLDLEDATIGGSVFIVEHTSSPTHEHGPAVSRTPRISGRIDMGSTSIASRFLIRRAAISACPGEVSEGSYGKSADRRTALHAPRLRVGARVQITGQSVINGAIDMAMCDISGLYVEEESKILTDQFAGESPYDALNLSNAQVGARVSVEKGVEIAGTVRLTGAAIHGDVDLHGVLSKPRQRALITGNSMTVDGQFSITGLEAVGGSIRLRGATLGRLDATRAKIHNPGAEALDLTQAVIRGSVHLRSIESIGCMTLNRSRIEGRLLLTDGTFLARGDPAGADESSSTHGGAQGPRPAEQLLDEGTEALPAIEAISADVHGGMDLGWKKVAASVNFTDATTTTLIDDPENWPKKFVIAGLTYQRLDAPPGAGSRKLWDADARCKWLARQAAYDSGPYEQAANVFRQQGYAREAEQILISQRDRALRAQRELAIERRKAHKDARQAGVDTVTPRSEGRPSSLREQLASFSWQFVAMRRAVAAALRLRANRTYGFVVGYGYRPGRVLAGIVLLLGLVFWMLTVPAFQDTLRATSPTGQIYSTRGPIPSHGDPEVAATDTKPDTCGDGQVRCFSVGLYTLDTVIPLISLDQRSTWYPDQHLSDGWMVLDALDTATVLGWILSTIFVLSLARFARSTS